jgi:hypothetical protein
MYRTLHIEAPALRDAFSLPSLGLAGAYLTELFV